MTRQHFENIARILKVTGAGLMTCNEMAIYFAELNPRFDKARFMAACGQVV